MRTGRVDTHLARLLPLVIVVWALGSLGSERLGMPEPYPSPLLPGFRGAPEIRETFEWASVEARVLDASGETHQLRGQELLADIPLIHTAVFDSAFFQSRDLDPASVTPTGVPSRFVYGLPRGRTAKGIRRHDHPQSVEWLRERIEALLPTVHPVEVTIYRQHWETRIDDGEDRPSHWGLDVTIALDLAS
jgi:hypothetical protein